VLNRHLIVGRIDFDQDSSLFDVFVVADVDTNHMAANARADWMEVRVNLGIVSGLIAGEVSPHGEPADD
jgi:hypothetical protein